MSRPYRSALYLPGSNDRALDKARSLTCDAIIFDLEDAVAPGEKTQARTALAGALGVGGYGPRARIVRINALGTEWGPADAEAVAGMACDGVLLPKVNDPGDLGPLAELIPGRPLWAMIETPLGVLNAAAIAAHPQLDGVVLGTNDLAKELGALPHPEREPLLPSLGLALLAARAHGKVALDGVFNAFRDEAGLRAECEQGRRMGFDGKTLIHPAQLATANEVFAPTEAEIDRARRQIAAHERAAAEGRGVAVLDGKIVENLHVATARATLDKARAIADLQAS